GPTMVVYPEGTWYSGMTADRMQRFVSEHLVGGRPIEEWIFARNPLADTQSPRAAGIFLHPVVGHGRLYACRARALGIRQGIPGEDPLLDRPAADEVLADETLHAVGGHAGVPGPFGIDDHGRP